STAIIGGGSHGTQPQQGDPDREPGSRSGGPDHRRRAPGRAALGRHEPELDRRAGGGAGADGVASRGGVGEAGGRGGGIPEKGGAGLRGGGDPVPDVRGRGGGHALRDGDQRAGAVHAGGPGRGGRRRGGGGRAGAPPRGGAWWPRARGGRGVGGAGK